MSDLSLFLKENKLKKENVFFAATSALLDEEGKPALWEIRAVSTKEDEEMRDACARIDEASGKTRLDVNRYLAKLLARSVVSPNLYSEQLQNSYGVNTPEELIKELLDNPVEYQALVKFVRGFGGLDVSQDERILRAKNS